MYTLEIRGVAVAMTDADEVEARELFDSEGFRQDLTSFTVGGEPLWDGKAEFVVRAASEDEIDLFDEAMDEDDFDDEDDVEDDVAEEGEDDFDEDGASVMFLVEIDQFGDEDGEL